MIVVIRKLQMNEAGLATSLRINVFGEVASDDAMGFAVGVEYAPEVC